MHQAHSSPRAWLVLLCLVVACGRFYTSVAFATQIYLLCARRARNLTLLPLASMLLPACFHEILTFRSAFHERPHPPHQDIPPLDTAPPVPAPRRCPGTTPPRCEGQLDRGIPPQGGTRWPCSPPRALTARWSNFHAVPSRLAPFTPPDALEPRTSTVPSPSAPSAVACSSYQPAFCFTR